jgi:hypothetical protein
MESEPLFIEELDGITAETPQGAYDLSRESEQDLPADDGFYAIGGHIC